MAYLQTKGNYCSKKKWSAFERKEKQLPHRKPHWEPAIDLQAKLIRDLEAKKICYCSKANLVGHIDGDISGDPIAKILYKIAKIKK
jgi:hypothetical protein